MSQAGSVLSWLVLAAWWFRTAGGVGCAAVARGDHRPDPDHPGRPRVGAHDDAAVGRRTDDRRQGLYLGLVGHVFLFFVALNPQWSLPPWPLFGCLAVVTLATSATAAIVETPLLHVLGHRRGARWSLPAWTSATGWAGRPALAAAAVVSLYALAWIALARDAVSRGMVQTRRRGCAVRRRDRGHPRGGRARASVQPVTAFPCRSSAGAGRARRERRDPADGHWSVAGWALVATGALGVAWAAVLGWQFGRDLTVEWRQLLALAGSLYAVFYAYALVAGPRHRDSREPWLVALGATAMAFFAGREAFEAGGLHAIIGVVPVVLGLLTAVLLRHLLRMESAGERDLTRLALVAGTALGLATVAIPLQLQHHWVTIGWALEGAALAWLFRRVPHRGLLLASTALLAVVFVRLALNPSIWTYEPRGALRIFNWYLYTYLLAAAAMGAAAWWLSDTSDRVVEVCRGCRGCCRLPS